MKMLFGTLPLEMTEIDTSFYIAGNIKLLVARLDKIHPVVSGNKLFKLHYFIKEALASGYQKVVTFGGTYSNHLVATAYACKISGLQSVGIVRGERPALLSHTLVACQSYGMRLQFISRKAYQQKDDPNFKNEMQSTFGRHISIPEGGYHPVGAQGASLIMDELKDLQATHVCTAIGTATTVAGLLKNRQYNEQVIGVPVIKNMIDIAERISFLNGEHLATDITLFEEYHFGGYAKKTTRLINFMNEFYQQYTLPTDFVYTAKMMYAVIDKIKSGYFPEGSIIVCLHTGGLQGNASLPPGTLVF
ncbi:MAG: pyridoxal-phosphate dependent enzyme [Ferruginibacter sp.]|nr:pyridoxal-phosphate dependent enzyme [Ferruginibacter sp.]